MQKVWVAVERLRDDAKRRTILRGASDEIKRWSRRDTARHHVSDGTVSLDGKTVLSVQTGKLMPTSDYWLSDALKSKAWTAVTVPLSR